MSKQGMPDAVAKRLGYALKRAQHALRGSMDNALRPLQLTTPQYAVLCAIEAEPGLSNARLARASFVTAQTMQGVLINLEKIGLLTRRPDPTHGRVILNELTAAGADVLARAHQSVNNVEQGMMSAIGPDDAGQLAALLSRYADYVEQHGT